jgi:kynureninase
VLSLAPLLASLDVVEKAGGITAMRAKSEKLTSFLDALIRARIGDVLQIVTPTNPAQRGCQLSLRVNGGRERGRELFEYLMSIGVVGDWREPDVIRISPTPLYNRFMDVYRFVEEVETWRGM